VLQFGHHLLACVALHDLFHAVFEDIDLLLTEFEGIQPKLVIVVEVADVDAVDS